MYTWVRTLMLVKLAGNPTITTQFVSMLIRLSHATIKSNLFSHIHNVTDCSSIPRLKNEGKLFKTLTACLYRHLLTNENINSIEKKSNKTCLKNIMKINFFPFT
jgi:hypothetical protein